MPSPDTAGKDGPRCDLPRREPSTGHDDRSSQSSNELQARVGLPALIGGCVSCRGGLRVMFRGRHSSSLDRSQLRDKEPLQAIYLEKWQFAADSRSAGTATPSPCVGSAWRFWPATWLPRAGSPREAALTELSQTRSAGRAVLMSDPERCPERDAPRRCVLVGRVSAAETGGCEPPRGLANRPGWQSMVAVTCGA